jgi:RNA polymerase sigma-70 factor (ECF subfamily)
VEWDVDCEPAVAAWSDPEAVLIHNANSERIRQAMAELPFEYREMLILRELEELSYKEIAEIAEFLWEPLCPGFLEHERNCTAG